jgi:hypothetical protein
MIFIMEKKWGEMEGRKGEERKEVRAVGTKSQRRQIQTSNVRQPALQLSQAHTLPQLRSTVSFPRRFVPCPLPRLKIKRVGRANLGGRL